LKDVDNEAVTQQQCSEKIFTLLQHSFHIDKKAGKSHKHKVKGRARLVFALPLLFLFCLFPVIA